VTVKSKISILVGNPFLSSSPLPYWLSYLGSQTQLIHCIFMFLVICGMQIKS